MNILLYYPGINLELNIASSIHVRGVVKNLDTKKNKYILVMSNFGKNIPNGFDSLKVGFNFEVPFPIVLSEIYAFVMILVKKRNFDILYQRETILGTGVLIKLLLKTKLITEVNGVIADELKIKSNNKQNIYYKVTLFLNKLQIKKSDIIVVVSESIKLKIIEYYHVDPACIRVIENGVDINLFRHMDMVECKNKLGLSTQYNYIAYVGSLEKWQGLDKLLDVMCLIKQKREFIKLLIIGDGPEKNTLKKYAFDNCLSDSVSFVGRIEHEIIPLFLNSTLICVAPFKSSRCASPLKLFEYMACGKAIIAHNICFSNMNNIMEEADFTQPLKIVEKILYLIDNENVRKRLETNSREYIINNFTWHNTANKIETVLEEVLK